MPKPATEEAATSRLPKVICYLTPSLLAWLDEEARRQERSRSHVLRRLVQQARARRAG